MFIRSAFKVHFTLEKRTSVDKTTIPSNYYRAQFSSLTLPHKINHGTACRYSSVRIMWSALVRFAISKIEARLGNKPAIPVIAAARSAPCGLFDSE